MDLLTLKEMKEVMKETDLLADIVKDIFCSLGQSSATYEALMTIRELTFQGEDMK